MTTLNVIDLNNLVVVTGTAGPQGPRGFQGPAWPSEGVQEASESARDTALAAEAGAVAAAEAAVISADSASSAATAAEAALQQAATHAAEVSINTSRAETAAISAETSEAAASVAATTATTQAALAVAASTALQADAAAANASSVLSAQHLEEIKQIVDTFEDQYLGAKSSDPVTDNDNNPLAIGALYYNSVSRDLRFYNGTSWDTPAEDATTAAANALVSAQISADYASLSQGSQNAALTASIGAAALEQRAADHAANAGAQALLAVNYSTEARAHATAAEVSATAAEVSASAAQASAEASQASANASEASAIASQLAADSYRTQLVDLVTIPLTQISTQLIRTQAVVVEHHGFI